MAKGDVVNDVVASVATGANSDFQPAAGVEVLIAHVGSSGTNATSDQANIDVQLFDGTNAADYFEVANMVTHNYLGRPLKFLINNGHYLRLTNQDGGSQHLFYTGIQTK